MHSVVVRELAVFMAFEMWIFLETGIKMAT